MSTLTLHFTIYDHGNKKNYLIYFITSITTEKDPTFKIFTFLIYSIILLEINFMQ